MLGAVLDYQAFYAMFPGRPIPEDGFHGNFGAFAVFLLPLIAGGHVLAVTVANHPAESQGSRLKAALLAVGPAAPPVHRNLCTAEVL